jgi:hypothetical protein
MAREAAPLIILHYEDGTECRINPDHIIIVDHAVSTHDTKVRATLRLTTILTRDVTETPLEIDRAIRDARIEDYVRLGEVARRKGWDYR